MVSVYVYIYTNLNMVVFNCYEIVQLYNFVLNSVFIVHEYLYI